MQPIKFKLRNASFVFFLLCWLRLLMPEAVYVQGETATPSAAVEAQVQSVNATDDRIVGLIWKDENANGIRELSDPFIPNATIFLYQAAEPENSSGTKGPILTTTATITGWYQLNGLATGDYYLVFQTPGRMLPTLPNQGQDERTDSDAERITGEVASQSAILTISNQKQTTQVDAGFVLPSTITTYVYNDLNRDNKRQVGEGMVAGATIILYDAKGVEIAQAPADNNGSFLAPDLMPGGYQIEIRPPLGYSTSLIGTQTITIGTPGTTLRYEAPVYLTPNVVALVSFRAIPQEGSIQVRWVTAAELNTQGFRLYREDDRINASALQVTPALIQSQGSDGGLYAVVAPYNPAHDAPLDNIRFWLVEYEITGKENRYGPFGVTQIVRQVTFLPLFIH